MPMVSAPPGLPGFTGRTGAKAVKIMCENPYRLAKDIRGIGFCSADQISQRLVWTKGDSRRPGVPLVNERKKEC
ncbi:helix-hairpin-helix domain-containing protein [Mesorhizobium sp. M1216]|uniref:helix-hairpin-helix domain-containing protein n=1 Tax=Mesorhizobium sp. M1216 TaxID=2957069 RepID=UPI00333B4D8D